MNNGVKLRRFIVPKKVEQINDHLFIDTYIDIDTFIIIKTSIITIDRLIVIMTISRPNGNVISICSLAFPRHPMSQSPPAQSQHLFVNICIFIIIIIITIKTSIITIDSHIMVQH